MNINNSVRTKAPALGVCYYPEHWPESIWSEDARRMRELGIRVVRIGEFAWSRLEPRDGVYELEWLERALSVLHAAGLSVVLGTPTATPPHWLVDKMSDMLALDSEGRARKFGSRRHYCFSHAGYSGACARIVSIIAERFGQNPAVIGWQTDNEYGCHDTVESYSDAARDAFRQWCARKYGEIDQLNHAWGNVFWSMELIGFDQIELPNLTVTEANPAHRLDFQRFSSDQLVAFNRRQVEILRKFSPGRAIIHNFMGSFTAFDHYALSHDLDVAAWDSYPLGFLERSNHAEAFKLRYMRVGDPDFQAFHHDLYRGCGNGRWWVMEQQPGAVNWGKWNPVPAHGAVRLWTHEAIAAGAEVVSYFRWRQAPFAQEQMHEGLLLPDSKPNAAYEEVARVAAEIDALAPYPDTRRAAVALVFDYESAWAWRIQPQGEDFSYPDLVFAFYRGLRRAGASVDIVPPDPAAVEGRRLVIAPGLFAPTTAFVAALENCGAVVLCGPRAGAKTADFQIPPDLPPGPLRGLVDITLSRVESLRPEVEIKVGSRGAIIRWREFMSLRGDTVAELQMADGEIALARNGSSFYLAGWPDEQLMDLIYEKLFHKAGLDYLALGECLRIRDQGDWRYFFNYGACSLDLRPFCKGFSFLLAGETLDPCSLAIATLTASR
ncbi:beta-galactosidase [Methylocystis echinoides]|uniref:Beta-galactosidase n=1 Tax=Methylocystis echinoides TaxID=29468 RepID=A0A9W6LSQ8_9HYPH|nr:beta-galactosidase [Methylocystis echinoides]GLI93833.1 beta-galactosidase [Methylocystis echinoides]